MHTEAGMERLCLIDTYTRYEAVIKKSKPGRGY